MPADCYGYVPLDELLEHIASSDIAKEAQELRPGHIATLVVPKAEDYVLKGASNVHIPIHFDDGVVWLARIGRKINYDKCDYEALKSSEMETMRALHAAGLPVPQVFSTSVKKLGNGCTYFFVEMIDNVEASNLPAAESDWSQSQIDMLIDGFADFQIKLANISFLAIGCIYKGVDGPATRVVDYLFYLELRRLVCHPAFDDTPNRFYIRHGEPKGDHFLAELPQCSLKAVIDWEASQTGFFGEVFAAPPAFWDLKRFFCDGDNTLSREAEELAKAFTRKGRPDLEQCVRNGRKYQRLPYCIGRPLEPANFNALVEAVTGEQFSLTETKTEWVARMSEKYKDDEGFRVLLRKCKKVLD